LIDGQPRLGHKAPKGGRFVQAARTAGGELAKR